MFIIFLATVDYSKTIGTLWRTVKYPHMSLQGKLPWEFFCTNRTSDRFPYMHIHVTAQPRLTVVASATKRTWIWHSSAMILWNMLFHISFHDSFMTMGTSNSLKQVYAVWIKVALFHSRSRQTCNLRRFTTILDGWSWNITPVIPFQVIDLLSMQTRSIWN